MCIFCVIVEHVASTSSNGMLEVFQRSFVHFQNVGLSNFVSVVKQKSEMVRT